MKGKLQYFHKLNDFLTYGVWNIRLKELSGVRYFFVRQLRILLLAIKGFFEDNCQLRASALTFYSVLSVVPVLALVFGIAKGFGLDNILERELTKQLSGQQELLQWLIDFANRLLLKTKGAVVAGLGLLVLFWSVVKVLNNMERSFNDVWQIKKGRPLGRRFSDYLAMMALAAVLMLTSSSITVFLTTQIKVISKESSVLEAVSPFLLSLLEMAPYLLIWILFTFLYIFMPNTRVNFRSGLIAGIIAGTIYQLVQWAYIRFQVGVSTYNAIYGSFSALPLFLVWLQTSWLILLFGAEISFAEQNVDFYEYKGEAKTITYDYKRLLSLYVCHLVVRNFSLGRRALSSSEISHTLEIPIRLVREIISELLACGILSQLETDVDKEHAYQPALDINRLSVCFVIDSLEKSGSENIPVLQNEAYASLECIMADYRKDISNRSTGTLLKDINP